MKFNHKHMIISAHNLGAPPKTADTMSEWLLDMVEAVDMKVLMGPYSTRCDSKGNEGVTGVIVIETSHISCHCWDTIEKPYLKADIYSCKDFDEDTVKNMFARFKPEYIDYLLVDRNNGNEVTVKVTAAKIS